MRLEHLLSRACWLEVYFNNKKEDERFYGKELKDLITLAVSSTNLRFKILECRFQAKSGIYILKSEIYNQESLVAQLVRVLH